MNSDLAALRSILSGLSNDIEKRRRTDRERTGDRNRVQSSERTGHDRHSGRSNSRTFNRQKPPSSSRHEPYLLGTKVTVQTGPHAKRPPDNGTTAAGPEQVPVSSGLNGAITGRTYEADPVYDITLATGHVLTGLPPTAFSPKTIARPALSRRAFSPRLFPRTVFSRVGRDRPMQP
ncbi:MAG: hypothetical protein HOK61_02910 [Alphaproteobacteria bacterium]|jgi:hypothetical protein|nr:hypothetical protein [Alphaproteobacteria bacterium]